MNPLPTKLVHSTISQDLTIGRAASEAASLRLLDKTARAGNHTLQDYQMQLMLLEQQNKKRLSLMLQEGDYADFAPPPVDLEQRRLRFLPAMPVEREATEREEPSSTIGKKRNLDSCSKTSSQSAKPPQLRIQKVLAEAR